MRGPPGERAEGGGCLEAWPKQTSFAEKKKKPNQNTQSHRAHPSSQPPPDFGLAPQPRASLAVQSRPDRSRRAANGTPGSAKAQKCERGAQSVKLPCLLEGGGTLTYIYPMGDGYGGGTVTQFGPMRQTGGGKHMALRVLPAREGG